MTISVDDAAKNILQAFENNADVALTQYLIACELDGVECNHDISSRLHWLAVNQQLEADSKYLASHPD